MFSPVYGKSDSLLPALIGTVVLTVVVGIGGCSAPRTCSPYSVSPNAVAKTCSDPNCPIHRRTVASSKPIIRPTVNAAANSRPANVAQPSRHYVPASGLQPQNDLLSILLNPPKQSSRPIQQARSAPPVRPTTVSPIRQASYQVQSASDESTSSELLKPWDIETIRSKTAARTPYRLVSDQSNEGKIPPPSGSTSLILSEASPTQTSASRNSSATVQTLSSATNGGARLPIFDLGKNLTKEFRPSNDRKWTQNHAVLQTAELNGNLVTVRNIRYSVYDSDGKYTTRYYDATFNLNDIRTIDLIIVPFRSMPRVAHVESSFGFADGRYLGMSIEARYEEGEKYDPVGAGLNQFELIYVFADERDLVRLGTDVHKNDVHVYRLRFEPREVREMFVDAIQRANALAAKPEFYHPLRNSCVTNLITHVNKGRPNAIPKEYRTLLPGLMDHYLYDLKLVETSAPTFKEAKENAKVNWLVEKYGDLEYFSAGIRQNMY